MKPSSLKTKTTNNPKVSSVLFEKSDLHLSLSTPNFVKSSNNTPSLNVPVALNMPNLEERRPSEIDLARVTALTTLKNADENSLSVPRYGMATSKSMTNLRLDDHECFEHQPVAVHFLDVKPTRKQSRSRSSSNLEDAMDLKDIKDLNALRQNAKLSFSDVECKSQTLPVTMPSQMRKEKNFGLKEFGTKLKKSVSMFPFTSSKSKELNSSQQSQDDRRYFNHHHLFRPPVPRPPSFSFQIFTIK